MPNNVSDIYTLYLKSRHLPPNGATAVIERVAEEELHPRPGQTSRKLLLTFKGKNRRLIINQRNANALADLAGEDWSKWVGVTVHLKPGKWGQKDTIILSGQKNGNGV